MDLGEGLRKALAKLTKSTIIDAKTIREFNKDLQKTLISADVEVQLVLQFTKDIEEKALKSKPPSGLKRILRIRGENFAQHGNAVHRKTSRSQVPGPRSQESLNS